jgi:hypothetical protein
MLATAAAAALCATGQLAADEPATEPRYSDEERSHWSFLPRTDPRPPRISDPVATSWIENPIDAFVLSKLREHNLQPTRPAKRTALARRIYFQLTGLPPTPRQVRDFVDDDAPDSVARLVDRLLSSPRYGEHWGQHWLDVIRFAETEGFEYDRYRPGAWRLRDYVVASINEDKPFDQFATELIAGDELSSGDETTRYNQRVAAGFHRVGPIRRNAGNPEVAFSRNEVLTEMTDIIGAAFLGLSVGCARCHDHFFDPIRQRDYYQLQSFLSATHEYNIPLVDDEEMKRWEAANDTAQAKIAAIKKRLTDADDSAKPALEEQLKAATAAAPEVLPMISGVRNDPQRHTAIHVLVRGNESKKAEPVGMRFLGVFLPEDSPELVRDAQRPKTKLAKWIADETHPLTGRVIANRIWHYHFGAGIVPSPNDFGANGQPPSHPELLDFLANELVRSGWSWKHLHRLILTSNTYRQASTSSQATRASEIDTDNRLLWRFRRRRLEAQEVRDTMLAVSGQLDERMGGPSIMLPVDQELIERLYKPDQWRVAVDRGDHVRRSVYLIAKRNLRLPFMEVFDQPDLQSTCPRREASTHAPQVLEMLNGPMAGQMAKAFAQRLRSECGGDHPRMAERAIWLVAGRPPTQVEQRLAEQFLREYSINEFALAMFNLNAFMYID